MFAEENLVKLRIRNWEKFQHYKFRKPPWIKLYREILDDPDWHKLSGESAKGLIMLWLIASEDDGCLPASDVLAFRLRISENRVIALLSDCSAWFEGDASTMLASCYQDAIPETETESEKEKPSSPSKKLMGSAEFHIFWSKYPRKVAKDEAIKAWVKGVCDGNLGEILAGVEGWIHTNQWTDMDKIPYPATWLNGRRWREIPAKGTTKNEQKRASTRQAIERVRAELDGQTRDTFQSTPGRGTN